MALEGVSSAFRSARSASNSSTLLELRALNFHAWKIISEGINEKLLNSRQQQNFSSSELEPPIR